MKTLQKGKRKREKKERKRKREKRKKENARMKMFRKDEWKQNVKVAQRYFCDLNEPVTVCIIPIKKGTCNESEMSYFIAISNPEEEELSLSLFLFLSLSFSLSLISSLHEINGRDDEGAIKKVETSSKSS